MVIIRKHREVRRLVTKRGHDFTANAPQLTDRACDIERATIVGGTAAVSEAVVQQMEELVAGVKRTSGQDRYETSTRAADLAVPKRRQRDPPLAGDGPRLADALAVARDGGVLLLVDGEDPVGSAATHAWLPGRDIRRGVVVGGTIAITPAVRAAIESSLVSGS